METLSAKLSDRMSAALAQAEALRAPTMTRDEAFTLLEAHFGPSVNLSIAEHTARYVFQRGTDHPEAQDFTVGFAQQGKEFTVFIRRTLSEAVAAAVSHAPAQPAPFMEVAA